MRKIYSLIIAFFIVNGVWAQKGYHIQGTVQGLKPAAYTLAHYFGANQYIVKDTALANTNGTLIFSGEKPLPEGLYMLLSPNKRRLTDFVIGNEQHFSFSSDTTHIVANMKIEGSLENQLFYQYQQQILGYSNELGILQVQQRLHQDLITQTKINNLRRQILSSNQQFVKEHSNTLAGKILNASAEIQLPAPPKKSDGRPDSAWLFLYYKAHFWDNFDFADERLVRMPTLQRKLDRYMQELTLQHPDSLIQSADFVINKALKGGSKELQAYCIWYLTNQAENPNTIGGDAVFVHLAEKYYIGGIMPISDSSTVQNIRTKVNTIKPLLVGKIMPPLTLTDTLGKLRSIADLKTKYTIIFFYDPDCGHCRESTPALKAFYEKNKANVQIYAASVARAPEQWKKYIRDFGVEEWIHGYDYSFRIDFRKDFDVSNTPVIYVLDQDKKIIARRLPVEQLDSFLDFHERRLLYEKELKTK
jgi:thiol-disulfide isomerase/thioredoxin